MMQSSYSSYLETESSSSSSIKYSRPLTPICIVEERPSTPLTAENLQFHSRSTLKYDEAYDAMKKFQASLNRDLRTSASVGALKRPKRSRSSMSLDTIIEAPQFSMFPYHNDSFLLPTPTSSANSLRSPCSSSIIQTESMLTIDSSSRGRFPRSAKDRPATANTSDAKSKQSFKEHVSSNSSTDQPQLLYVEARPSKLSLTLSKLLQWLNPAALKTRKDLRRRASFNHGICA
ncbi:hypothetical protein INT43_001189 [Umbelopsis isabellina]|uniref:Uncharacterized protein n=1 Tax=Mortierella isabellina TaxID=91625 RepID=A0A8H7PK64_MORIS|nr:hypothetical protein INT43_001189 [Umbelopsis isabellina]